MKVGDKHLRLAFTSYSIVSEQADLYHGWGRVNQLVWNQWGRGRRGISEGRLISVSGRVIRGKGARAAGERAGCVTAELESEIGSEEENRIGGAETS